jgi:predicted amidophosphoribosyltransferase
MKDITPQQCPSCERVLYNRRLALCGYCGAEIPVDRRFTEQEIARLDQEMAELKARSEQREAEREAERSAKHAAALQDSSLLFPGF